MFQIQSFTCEGLREHLVTDCAAPTFAYFVSSDRAGASVQSAELTVNGWTIRNPDQCGTRYAGQPLKPFTTYTATLTVTSDSGETDTARLTFETGRMDTPWQGKWITDGAYVFKEKKVSPVPMVFRKALPLRGEIAQAKLYATAMGIYELNIDGQKVGERYFAPGFTSYAHQLMYQTYDVTDMLHSGSCITATVAGGWAVGSFVFTRVNRVTADRQALLAELRITYRDGRTEVIGTDESWQVTEDGPVRMADFYDGETYDATISLDKANWRSAVQERLRVKPKLMADYGADVKEHETFAPVSCKKLGNALIYDFGQNFAGVVRLTVTGKRGQKITIRHSEVLNPDGTLNTAFLRTAKATATYICKEGRQTWSPRLTYMGFRYISVEGVREEDVQVTGVMLYSDIQQTGSFRCSNEMLNRLQENIVRSAKSNFMDIPTDCPQRDERMGWTGDAQAFCPTANYNMDCGAFYTKYIRDLLEEQKRLDGKVPDVAPLLISRKPGEANPMLANGGGHCGWADAAAIVPWETYIATGDISVLKNGFESMKLWADWIYRYDEAHGATRLWPGIEFHFADWLALDGPESGFNPESVLGGTDITFLCSAYYYKSTMCVANAARALGKTTEYDVYKKRADEILDAIRREFYTAGGRCAAATQTGNAISLSFGLAPEFAREKITETLRGLLAMNKGKLKTGFLGTPVLCRALSDNGANEEAYTLLLNEENPGWLYEVNMGATTIWERWNSVNPDGKISGIGMNSMNHYAYGAVFEWVYKNVCGLNPVPDVPGYKKAVIRPQPDVRLGAAKAKVSTAAGYYETGWQYEDNGEVTYTVVIPFDAEAEVYLPKKDGTTEEMTLTAGTYTFTL